MMKVLWFCNCPISNLDTSGSGTWLGSMAEGLLDTGQIDLGVIAHGQVKKIIRQDCGPIQQWIVPLASSFGRKGLPAASLVKNIVEATNEFSPDLVQVWGTESYWGLLTARGLLRYPSLLTVQGFKSTVAENYFGGLSWTELLRCVGVKEVLKRQTMWQRRIAYKKGSRYEREIIKGHCFIETQSPWSTGQVQAVNPSAEIFDTECALRSDFVESVPWRPSQGATIFCSSAYSAPFKGLHVSIRALAILRQRVPQASMRIAGSHQRKGLRKDGYVQWLNHLIQSLGLKNSIEWLGAISSAQIVHELRAASLALVPSYIESYCVAMAEAMRVGAPIVSAFTGGTSYLGRNEQSCLFFPPGDAVMCAYQMGRILSDPELAMRLSRQAREDAASRHYRADVVRRQVDTYRKVLCAASL